MPKCGRPNSIGSRHSKIFLDFLRSPDARRIIDAKGIVRLPTNARPSSELMLTFKVMERRLEGDQLLAVSAGRGVGWRPVFT